MCKLLIKIYMKKVYFIWRSHKVTFILWNVCMICFTLICRPSEPITTLSYVFNSYGQLLSLFYDVKLQQFLNICNHIPLILMYVYLYRKLYKRLVSRFSVFQIQGFGAKVLIYFKTFKIISKQGQTVVHKNVC